MVHNNSSKPSNHNYRLSWPTHVVTAQQQLPLTRKGFGPTGRRPDPRAVSGSAAWPRRSPPPDGGFVAAPGIARLTRGQTLSVREREFVAAARVCGASAFDIMGHHIWPNVTAPIIVQATLLVASAILTEASLSFLGVGVKPPTPSWGSMLRTGSQYLEVAPWLAFAPGAAIFATVLAFNFVGDALRDAADVRSR